MSKFKSRREQSMMDSDEAEENAEFQRLQSRYATSKKRNISLLKKVDDLESRLKDSETAVEQMNASVTKHSELMRQNQTLRSSLLRAERKAKKLVQDNKALTVKVETVEKNYEERLNEMRQLIYKLEKVTSVAKQLQHTQVKHDADVKKMQEKYQHKCKELEFAEKCLKKAQAYKLHKELRMTIIHHAEKEERLQKIIAHQRAERNALLSQLQDHARY